MPEDAPAQARTHIETAWYRFIKYRYLNAKIPAWRMRTAVDGSTLLSVEVVGRDAVSALALFTGAQPADCLTPGDTRPVVDYDTPGRVACVWRTGGVWIELWHHDSVTHTPAPAVRQSRTVPARRPLFGCPSGRLPFTRRSKTKEDTTA